jgi:low affinity Fe/Cu permease
VWTAHPAAFLIVLIYAGVWAIFEPERLDWHGVATLATWVMTLFIQRAEHRDTQAIHAKLDELLHVHGTASNALTGSTTRSRRRSSATAEHARTDDYPRAFCELVVHHRARSWRSARSASGSVRTSATRTALGAPDARVGLWAAPRRHQ